VARIRIISEICDCNFKLNHEDEGNSANIDLRFFQAIKDKKNKLTCNSQAFLSFCSFYFIC
jgi:hypothetical protein